MNNAMFGLGLMTSVMASQGVMFGYQLEEEGKKIWELRPSYFSFYFFYIGALMCAPEAMRRVVPSYLGYASATICAGVTVAVVFAFLAALSFRAGNRFRFRPGPARTETKAPK